MAGVMLVIQQVASVEQWSAVFRDPALDAVRRDHGLVVTGTYVDAADARTVIVVMDMHDLDKAREFATSRELATARIETSSGEIAARAARRSSESSL